MPKIKSLLLISALVLVGLFLGGWIVFSRPAVPRVELTTQPGPTQIIPFEAEAKDLQSPVKFSLQAIDQTGQPLTEARMHLQLLTPPANLWLPTDFPISEGTTLLDIEAPAPQGELHFQQMLPLRGSYRLRVEVMPMIENAFEPFQETLTLKVDENAVKFRNFGILAVILLAVGAIGGGVIGQKQQTQIGEIAPQSVRMLLSGATLVAIAALLVVNISAEQSSLSDSPAHAPAEHPPHSHPRSASRAESSHPGQAQSQGLALELSAKSEARVGELTPLRVRLTDSTTKQPITGVKFQITLRQLENNWVDFSYTGSPNSIGEIEWQQQFFDGAPHEFVVEATPLPAAPRQFEPLQLTERIEVQGIAPPLSVRLVSLAYMTGILGIGLLLGLKLAGPVSKAPQDKRPTPRHP
jgi:hypothetical protein